MLIEGFFYHREYWWPKYGPTSVRGIVEKRLVEGMRLMVLGSMAYPVFERGIISVRPRPDFFPPIHSGLAVAAGGIDWGAGPFPSLDGVHPPTPPPPRRSRW